MEVVKEKDDFTEYPELNNLLTSLKISCDSKVIENETKMSASYETNNPILEFLSRENSQLKDFITKIENYENNTHEEYTYKVDKQNYWGKVYPRITLQPIYARPFMPKKVWNKSSYFILSSATLLDTDIYIQESGLDLIFTRDEIKHISVPSTFPIENRPIINATVGKLTYETRETVLPIAIKRVEEILDIEKGNIAIHCHSYDNVDAIYNNINPKYKERIIKHESNNRQEQLNLWKNSRGKVFLAVNFEEGQDWVGDICTAQILFKVPYPNLTDKRTRIRIYGKHESEWFDNETMKKVIQSYGRAVRTEQDRANFYIIDFSFFNLIGKCKNIPAFFIEAPVKGWEDWKKKKTPTGEQVCGQCTHFEPNCSHYNRVIYRPIKHDQWRANVGLVGQYSSVAENCHNFDRVN
jgi:Rad3-related DNA helicase